MTNKDRFLEEYKAQLIKAVDEHPEEYAYPVSECEFVFARMNAAIEQGFYNKDSRAFRQTCKALKIKHTYQAIRAFLSTGTVSPEVNTSR